MSTISFANGDEAKKLKEWIDEVLEVLDIKDAWVSDRTVIWDFMSEKIDTKAKQREYTKELSEKFGFKVYIDTKLIDIAWEIKEKNLDSHDQLTKSYDIAIGNDCITPICLTCLGSVYGCFCKYPKLSVSRADIRRAREEKQE